MRNPWSWHILTSIVYVDQPGGTGFSTGVPTITNEEELAAQFLGWWKNFVDTFGMQGYKVYISGESYAGMYCPYIANAMLNTNDTTYHQLSGMYLGDAVIGDNTQLYQSIPMLRFVEYHSSLFPFNNTFLDKIRTTDAECGYSSLLDNHLVYPPISHLPSALPEVSENGTVTEECTSLWWWILEAALRLNPCFDMYHITASCPRVSDVLGFLAGIDYVLEGKKRYFDRGDVKAAIHAPRNVTWEVCGENQIFAQRRGRLRPVHHLRFAECYRQDPKRHHRPRAAGHGPAIKRLPSRDPEHDVGRETREG